MDNSPSRAVLLAVADAEGVDPTDLPSLYEATDPDALDRLLSRDGGQVRFNYHGYQVTVGQQGIVALDSVSSNQSQTQRSADLHRVMETTREGMSLVRPDGTFSFVNAAFANVFEYERHELLGEHWTVLYHNEEAKRLAEDILPAVRETGYWSGETVRFTKHGEPRVTDHRLALTDEDVILCTATDITPNQTASGLDARDVDAMVDKLEDGAFFTLDHEGHVTRWNEAVEHLEGYETPEILGDHVSIFFSGEDRDQGLPEQLLEVAKNRGTVTDEGWRVRNDGTRFWVDLTIVASYDDAGTIRGYRAMIRETSDTPADA